MENTQSALRQLPKMDELLESSEIVCFKGEVSPNAINEVLRGELEQLRQGVRAGKVTGERAELKERVVRSAAEKLKIKKEDRLKRVINATGVIIHTNLGRAPLSEELFDNMREAVTGYCCLEYDVFEGKRRSRMFYLEEQIKELTGAEAAIVVNNNAAALYLALDTLCPGKEIIISRGEIVEIGDSFRILDIMEKSGGIIKEAGSTNKTRIEDYERLINGNTSMLLKAHCSNFKMTGFTGEASTRQLAELSKKRGLIMLEDLGSGVLPDLSRYGIRERSVSAALKDGADIVTFSGDKMLGGPQAGIIAGKKEYIDQMKRNQAYRCLRMDKLCLAALAYIFRLYQSEKYLELPVFKMLIESPESVQQKAERLLHQVRDIHGLTAYVGSHKAVLGGGAMPGEAFDSSALFIELESKAAWETEQLLRHQIIPIITTIADDKVVIDVRTVSESDFEYISHVFSDCLACK